MAAAAKAARRGVECRENSVTLLVPAAAMWYRSQATLCRSAASAGGEKKKRPLENGAAKPAAKKARPEAPRQPKQEAKTAKQKQPKPQARLLRCRDYRDYAAAIDDISSL